MTEIENDLDYEAQLQAVLEEDGKSQEVNGHAARKDSIGVDKWGPAEDNISEETPNFHFRATERTKNFEGGSEASSDLDLRPQEEDNLSEDARSISTGDDSPSIQGGVSDILSTSPTPHLNGGHLSPTRAFSPSKRPFDIRPHQRLSSYSSLYSRSPTSSHSRLSSSSSNIADLTPDDGPSIPWEVVRWTSLKRIGRQAFSEIAKRKFGEPTVLTVSGVLAIGTSKGLILIFDFKSTLRAVIGMGTKATQSGPITALAFSADHTVIAGGHASGDIFTWELSRSAQPHSHCPTVSIEQISKSKKDGHVSGASILHLDFLGLRHGSFVSADETGMAFYHTISRKMVVASIRTTRLLGRYPASASSSSRPIHPHKPNTLLAMASLPLGNSKYRTDEMQLIAMLSPIKLVIVSVLPFPQTQYRRPLPKRAVSQGSILSGCLAWYPAFTEDTSGLSEKAENSRLKPKIVYSWDRYLAIQQVSEIVAKEGEDYHGPPRLEFTLIGEWNGEETIVAVQWLLPLVLVVLTVSQRLLILDVSTMQVTSSCDLLMKQILHHDRFSARMSTFPAVADAYYHSFKTFKHKIFLMCADEMYIGTLLNWADRILALVNAGDFIEAIALATSYYNGKNEKITLGLPTNDAERHAKVQKELSELINTGLKLTFTQNDIPEDQGLTHAHLKHRKVLQNLAMASIDACLQMNALSFLFEDVYDIFEGFESRDIFFEVLEPYILDDRIQSVPPDIVKDLTQHFISQNFNRRLEQIICHVNPDSLDIDQITSFCRQHELYDALTFVYNAALKDYTTPMVEFIELVKKSFENPKQRESVGSILNLKSDVHSTTGFEGFTIFPYLAYILTGRIYPTGEDMEDEEASRAKVSLYYFLFSGRTLTWPREGGHLILTSESNDMEPTFPYLRLLLRFDAPMLFQAMDEAFEDRFLNGNEDVNGVSDGAGESSFGKAINRQFIIEIFLEVMGSDPSPDIVYLYMFIARNLPKYPQFILLSGSSLERILLFLCTYGQTELAEDCQLAAEHLLSIFKPMDSEKMIAAYSQAKFYRILKATYRMERQYTELLLAYLMDEGDKQEVFQCIQELLRPGSALNGKQRADVCQIVLEHLSELVDLDTAHTAEIIDRYASHLHPKVLLRLQDRRYTLFEYLHALFGKQITTENERFAISSSFNEPDLPSMIKNFEWINNSVRELYISLLCEFNRGLVTRYLETLTFEDIRNSEVLSILEKYDIIDAVILFMRRAGLTKEALQKVLGYLRKLREELLDDISLNGESLVRAWNPAEVPHADGLLKELRRYAFVGLDLCEIVTSGTRERATNTSKVDVKDVPRQLNQAETMWLDLIETVVAVAKDVSASTIDNESTKFSSTASFGSKPGISIEMVATHISNAVRFVVQDVFSRLLSLTSSSYVPSQSTFNSGRLYNRHISFLSILRAFLFRYSSNVSDLRSVIDSMFDAYKYQEQLTNIAKRLVNTDLFNEVIYADKVRKRGWRTRNSECKACGQPIWGQGAGKGIFESWDSKRREEARVKILAADVRAKAAKGFSVDTLMNAKSTGKAKAVEEALPAREMSTLLMETKIMDGDIVLFACGHGYHRKCLAELNLNFETDRDIQNTAVDLRVSVGDKYRCILCSAQ